MSLQNVIVKKFADLFSTDADIIRVAFYVCIIYVCVVFTKAFSCLTDVPFKLK